ncbi:MAG: hypothetical protein HYX91_04225 [Chloroflexi bacterium]|nr:hypothetical protein [Chloroflexota bacterium]
MSKSKKRKFTLGEKRLLLGGFRLATLSLALIELSFDAPQNSYMPAVVLAGGAIFYSFFKLVHPLRWYTSPLSGTALTVIDILVCATLVFAHRAIHAPFALYSLNPVLTAAMMFRPGATRAITSVTAGYYTLDFFLAPTVDTLTSISSFFATYLVALGLTAWLPYLVNSDTYQHLRSSTIAEERLKLGREIHDGLCQTIYGLRLELQMLHRDIRGKGHLDKRLRHLNGLLDIAEKEARGTIESLRSFRDDRPFLSQVEDSLKCLKGQAGIEYQLEAISGEPRLDNLVKIEVLRICEETFRNIAKHSRAGEVKVTVRSPNGHLQVAIADDGRGMPDTRPAPGHGLMFMKERAESLGGNMQVFSIPGLGTEIRVEVPRKWSPELATR